MWWQCGECGAEVMSERAPVVCSECGRAADAFERISSQGEMDADVPSRRDGWFRAGLEGLPVRTCADVAWAG